MPRKTKHNKITSPELIAEINKENMRLLDDFLAYLRSVKRSEGTIAGYKNDLLIFFVYVLENLDNKPFQKISKRDLIAYQNWLVGDHENSPARVRRMKSAISSLSNYVENILADDEEEFKGFRSIIRKIESPALQPVQEKAVFSEEEIEDLLGRLAERGDHEKACLLALAAYSGRRKSELTRFKVSDFSEENLVCDGALYKSAPIRTKGRSGGKYIPCYTLAKKFKPYFDKWMEQRKAEELYSEWLFPDKSNPEEHMKTTTVSSWADVFSRMLGRDFYMHSMRHLFTTNLVRAGIPDSVIAQIVGWESVDMCKTYTDMETDEQIGMYFKDGDIAVPEKTSLGSL